MSVREATAGHRPAGNPAGGLATGLAHPVPARWRPVLHGWLGVAGGAARRALDALPHPRRTPFTFGYLMVLLATTLLLFGISDNTADVLMGATSTNLHELAHHPVFVLIASAAWLPSQDWLYYALAFTLLLAPLERRLGTARAVLVVATGHVLVSLLTEGAVGVGIVLHKLPVTEATQIDVGPSYLLMTAIGATIGLLPTAIRWPVLGTAAFWLVYPLLDGLDMTDLGHLLCLFTGVASWFWLRRRGLLGTMWPARPVGPAMPGAAGRFGLARLHRLIAVRAAR